MGMPLAPVKGKAEMNTIKPQTRPPAMGYPWRNATAFPPVRIAGGLSFFGRLGEERHGNL
jgi:hypothetical protein